MKITWVTETFACNLRDEPIQANRYGATLQYDCDGAGKFRRNDDREPGVVTANTGNLLPDSSTAMPYAFDVNGNLEAGEKVVNIEFDAFGRLVYTKTQNGVEAIYGYNTAGQRVSKKVVDGRNSSIVLYPTKQVSYEPNATESFVFVGNERIAESSTRKRFGTII